MPAGLSALTWKNMQRALLGMAKRKSRGVSFVVAIEGHLKEGSGLTFPGDCTVFTETVAEQTDVFGTP